MGMGNNHSSMIVVLGAFVLLFGLLLVVQEPEIEISEAAEVITEEVVHEPEEVAESLVEVLPIDVSEVIPDAEILNTVTVYIKSQRFHPNELIIAPNTKVTWVNNDSSPHKVVEYKRRFYGERIVQGESWEVVFNKIGTFTYFTATFPKMGKGKIIVQEEPLPITGNAVLDMDVKEKGGKFALLVLLMGLLVSVLCVITHKKRYH
jgi:plastocyanin